MAEYRIAERDSGEYLLVKVTQQGQKATIIPPIWRLMSRATCRSSNEIVNMEDFSKVNEAHPNSVK